MNCHKVFHKSLKCLYINLMLRFLLYFPINRTFYFAILNLFLIFFIIFDINFLSQMIDTVTFILNPVQSKNCIFFFDNLCLELMFFLFSHEISTLSSVFKTNNICPDTHNIICYLTFLKILKISKYL